MSAMHIYGVDVAMRELVAAHKGSPGTRSVSNEAKAIIAWLKELPPGSIIAMESTGRHHRLLAELAVAAGCIAYVLNAKDVSFYAKALSGRSKTDKVDAHVIARFVAEHHGHLHPWQASQPHVREIWELSLRRAEVTKHRASLRQAMRDVPTIAKGNELLEEGFDRLLEAIDERVLELQEEDEQLSRTCKRLQTIKGIGPQGGAMLSALFARIPFANADALVAYTGLDPRANDSGEKKGRRRLSKRGPAPLRRQAYLMAKAAIKSKVFKPMYEALKAKGFAPTQALVIMARKLLRVAFAVWKSGNPFDPARFASHMS